MNKDKTREDMKSMCRALVTAHEKAILSDEEVNVCMDDLPGGTLHAVVAASEIADEEVARAVFAAGVMI